MIARTDRSELFLKKCFILRPTIAVLRALGPVIFERFLPRALVDTPVRRLVGFMGDDALGVLQMQHAPIGGGFFGSDDVFQELA